MRKVKRLVEIIREGKLSHELLMALQVVMSAYDPSVSMSLNVHMILFKTALESAGTPEQLKKYSEDVK